MKHAKSLGVDHGWAQEAQEEEAADGRVAAAGEARLDQAIQQLAGLPQRPGVRERGTQRIRVTSLARLCSGGLRSLRCVALVGWRVPRALVDGVGNVLEGIGAARDQVAHVGHDILALGDSRRVHLCACVCGDICRSRGARYSFGARLVRDSARRWWE